MWVKKFISQQFLEDNQYFSIDRETGLLFFKQAPDFESSKVIYEVTILVESGSTSSIPKYNVEKHTDQRTYIIEVIDGPEYPNFFPSRKLVDPELIKTPDIPYGTQKEFQTTTQEDNFKVFFLDDLNASDPNEDEWVSDFFIWEQPKNGSAFFNYAGDLLSMISFEDEVSANEAVKETELRYIPDANYSGTDEFIIGATSTSGLPTYLRIFVDVEPENDPPAFLSSVDDVITIDENTIEVQRLFGKDDDYYDRNTTKSFLSGLKTKKYL